MKRAAAVMAAVLFALSLHAEQFRLYLKEGGYHLVREYKAETDRVRYYSVERADWEEIPLDLVDLKKTEAERKQRLQSEKEQAARDDEEEAFERAVAREVSRIPQDAGVYYIENDKAVPLKQAESKIVSNKRRSVLKIMVGVPLISGKATIEIDGEASAHLVPSDRPTFYFRLWEQERFGLVRLKPKKGARVVEEWDIVPVTKEIVAKRDEVEIFRQQMRDGLYKIWPREPLAPGEYAVIEYTLGQGNTQIWDFRVAPPAK
jgi:hypothetical protein